MRLDAAVATRSENTHTPSSMRNEGGVVNDDDVDVTGVSNVASAVISVAVDGGGTTNVALPKKRVGIRPRAANARDRRCERRVAAAASAAASTPGSVTRTYTRMSLPPNNVCDAA
jgi:hypothetical protein